MKLYQKILFSAPVMRFYGDPYFSGECTLVCGITTNFLFAAFNGCTGYIYLSPWFIALCVYYVLLSIIRITIFMAIHNQNHKQAEYDVASWDRVCEWRPYFRTGVMLLMLTACMTAMVIQMIFDDRAFIYPGFILYVFLAFATYLVVGSLYNLFRYRRWGFPSLSASGCVSLTGALMAVLAAQSALLHQFSPEHTEFRMIMNGITGTIVLILCYGIDLLMISRGYFQIKRCKNREPMPEKKGLAKRIADIIEIRD